MTPDLIQIESFVRALFRHAAPGNFVSLRAFYEDAADRRPFKIAPIKLNGNLEDLIDRAYRVAELAASAQQRVVFCPPIATFINPRHARAEDLAEGLTLSVECDARAQAARIKLEGLLGPATVVVASGGVWTDPETGKAEPKLHLHYRLKSPASDKDTQDKLKKARKLATMLVGGDPSNVPLAHPIRWPGSVHRKGEPTLCRIISLNSEAEIDLDAALQILQKAAGNGHDKTSNGAGSFDQQKIAVASALGHLDPQQPLAEGIERPLLLPFAPIKKGCGWLRHVHDTGGQDQSEVLWRNSLRVSMFLQNGEALIHEFSNKHPGYDFGATEKKYDEAYKAKKSNDLGYPKCETIRSHGSEQCKSCAHLAAHAATGKSPLHLGLPGTVAGVKREDFYAYMLLHSYMFAPSRELWPAASVNARIPPVVTGVNDVGKELVMKASLWIDKNQPVEMMTWAPGMPMIIADRLIVEGGWIERQGVSCFNLYVPPTIELGDAGKAGPWIELVHKVYPNDADHMIKWFAHRRQRPHIKINHCLLMGGAPGIGKDTILEPIKRAVGPWNFKETAAKNIFDSFNPWLRATILRINEAKDMGDISRFDWYEATKTLMAAPPDVLPCNEKHIRQHWIVNCAGVVITTNHRANGIYLPPDDRRHYVAWSDCVQADFPPDHFTKMWKWYEEGGDRHVAAYLATLDLAGFDPKAVPLKTAAFWSIVNANRTTEEGELQDVLDKLGNPDAVTIEQIRSAAVGDFSSLWDWLSERKNRKTANHRLENCGYHAVNNPDPKDGLWRIGGRRQVVYAKDTLSLGEQLKAAETLQRQAAAVEAAKAAKATKEAEAANAKAAEDAMRMRADILEQAKTELRNSPTSSEAIAGKDFQIIEECGPETICYACGERGGVKRIKLTGIRGEKPETMHQECAAVWFHKG